MGLFSTDPKVTTVESIKAASENALSVFHVALAALRTANEEATTFFDSNEAKIQALIDTNDALNVIREDNDTTIDNIGKILSPKKSKDEEAK